MLITLEGIDGSGKSSLRNAVFCELKGVTVPLPSTYVPASLKMHGSSLVRR